MHIINLPLIINLSHTTNTQLRTYICHVEGVPYLFPPLHQTFLYLRFGTGPLDLKENTVAFTFTTVLFHPHIKKEEIVKFFVHAQFGV